MKHHAFSPRIEVRRHATPRCPDPRRLRDALGMTAQQFADTYGIAVGTVRDWDCNRYKPDRTARAYLRRIEKFPALLREDAL
jgi:DNA-binding transcriptional regulator YiaG